MIRSPSRITRNYSLIPYTTLFRSFETLTLIHTGKMKPIPVLFFGQEFWNRVVDFQALADEGVISPEDLNLFHFVETAEDAWEIVEAFYKDADSSDWK